MPPAALRQSPLRLRRTRCASARTFGLAAALGCALAGAALAKTATPAAKGALPTAPDSAGAAATFAAPAPAFGVQARDTPNDRGTSVDLSWKVSPDEAVRPASVLQYYLQRSKSAQGPFVSVDSASAGNSEKTDASVERGHEYFYRIAAAGPGGQTVSLVAGPVHPTSQWFNTTRASVFLATVLFFLFVLYFITSAQRGKALFVRRIPGIDAIEEAIGRATEMGRSVLYVPGIQDIDDIQTMASLTILESVAKTTAKYETPIIVPVNYPVVMTLAQEMVKNGYVAAGRADAYDPNSVRYVTTEQFAYVAAVTGIMLRDQPAANIYLGPFYAESLLLAETGFATKAIQVAGTANVAQLPFFVVACDYTLIGEELYAASAYLSREPRLLGSLKGSDLMKVLIILAIAVGCVLETAHVHVFTEWMATQ